MPYEPTWESVSTHEVPDWYRDAKLGIFLHWGLYSVPGWAPQVADIQDLLRSEGPAGLLRDNPYAEWYRNSMAIPGGPTWQHHRDTYGADFPYDGFREEFDADSEGADLDALAETIAATGARYAVLTTKHHDGFTLWPASVPHPHKGAYHARRDLVGELTEAIRRRGLRMGLYYSGGYDWPFNDAVLRHAADCVLAVPYSQDYADYATAHVRELVARYAPHVLWNDICWPAHSDLAALFAAYYNQVPDGVVNDRWLQPTQHRGAVSDVLLRGAGEVVEVLWRHLPDDARHLTFPAAHHYDVETPEYQTFATVRERPWETVRGVGHSFGANRNERLEDIVTATELVRSFCDIISKNGNLLIGIGPRPDGTVPDEQLAPLRGLGEWLGVNGSAVYGSRPWSRAEGVAADGTPVRYVTTREGSVAALLLETPATTRLRLPEVDLGDVATVRLLGVSDHVAVENGDVVLPEQLPVTPALVLDLGTAATPRR